MMYGCVVGPREMTQVRLRVEPLLRNTSLGPRMVVLGAEIFIGFQLITIKRRFRETRKGFMQLKGKNFASPCTLKISLRSDDSYGLNKMKRSPLYLPLSLRGTITCSSSSSRKPPLTLKVVGYIGLFHKKNR